MEKERENYRVGIIEPTLIHPVGGERIHARPGDELTVPAQDAFDLVASGKARVLDGQLPNELKRAAQPKR